MSAVLGPIHYWLYNKIELQEALIEELLRWANEKGGEIEELREESYKLYGTPVRGKLEEYIDASNIHGWLQDRLISVEHRLAYIFTHLLDDKYITIEEAKSIFNEQGIKTAKKIKVYALDEKIDVREVYKKIFDCLPEGMPCDRVNEVIRETEEEVVWKMTKCVHEEYWKEVGGDIIYYYMLRRAWIQGFLKNSGLQYEEIQKHTFTIRR
nr:hypothetical protein [uncultured Niameybacter sp.]